MLQPDVQRRTDLKYNDNRYLRKGFGDGLTSGYLPYYNGTILADSAISYSGVNILIDANCRVTGAITVETCINAGTDTDKFLVWDAENNIDFRTGTELLADIGGAPAFSLTPDYLPKAATATTLADSSISDDGSEVTIDSDLYVTNGIGIGDHPIAGAGLFCNLNKTNNENVYGAYYNTAWTPTVGGSYNGYGFIQTLTADGTVNIANLYTSWSRLLIQGSGTITGSVYLNYGELKPNSTTKTITGNVALAWAATALSGSKVAVGGYSYQMYLGDPNTSFTIAAAKRFGIVQAGSTNVNYFQGKIQIVSDSLGLELGAGQDAKIYYDGSDLVFDSRLVGSGDFYFKNGDVGAGTSSPAQRLHSNVEDTNDQSVIYPLRISHEVSITAGNGIGVGMEFVAEDMYATNVVLAVIEAINSRATGAAEGKLYFKTYDEAGTGLVERMAVDYDGTISIQTCADAGTDTDKFLVWDSNKNIDYRTGAEVLSDIGAASALSLTTNYIPKAASATTLGNSKLYELSNNIGFGTTTPNAKLSLGNDVTAIKLLLYDNNALVNYKYGFGVQADELRAFCPSDAHVSLGTISTGDGSTWSEKMRITYEGNVGIGETVPVRRLHANEENAVNNAITHVIRLSHETTGSAANGIGVGMEFVAEDLYGTMSVLATISAEDISAEDNSNKGELVIATYDRSGTGLIERFRILYDGTVRIQTCVDAGVDTDSFLVWDAAGNIDYRTGAEVLSDIGASPVTTLSSGTMTLKDGATTRATATSYFNAGAQYFSITIPEISGTVTSGQQTTISFATGVMTNPRIVTPMWPIWVIMNGDTPIVACIVYSSSSVFNVWLDASGADFGSGTLTIMATTLTWPTN